MRVIRYVCTHCGRRFEAEEKEILECPGCFWSTTVKKEEDVRPEIKSPVAAQESSKPSFQFPKINFPNFPWKPVLTTLAILALIFFAAKFALPRLRERMEQQRSDSIKISPAEKAAANKKKKQNGAAMASGLDLLPPEEKNILGRHVQLTTGREPDEEEKKILDQRAAFQTGFVEKLPSQSWSLENFKQMVAEQERFYKVPLPHSYKSKLEAHFKEKYLAAQAQFEAGDLLKARDLWIDSLVFPIYSNDVQKHRGVVLTMIRPFINDTLSKIGAINGTLGEKQIREKEQAVNKSYADFLDLIQKKSWEEALAAVAEMDHKMQELEKPEKVTSASPYPASIEKVDEGIRATLLELKNPPPPAVADLEPMRQDIEAKRKVIESFIPKSMQAAQDRYDHALLLIGRQQWREAEAELRQIELPASLARDAQEKIKILKKIQESEA